MVLGHHCGPFLLGTKPSCTVLKITSYKCNISVAYVELKQTVVYGAVQERRVVTQEEIAMRGVENFRQQSGRRLSISTDAIVTDQFTHSQSDHRGKEITDRTTILALEVLTTQFLIC